MTDSMPKKVAVLMGGWSAEREVSLVSGKAVVKAVKELGHVVIPIDLQPDLKQIVNQLTPKPDVAINVLHGRWGEDGRIQAILDIMQIPYSYSGVLASSLAMNKQVAKQVFKSIGLPTPKGVTLPIKKAFSAKVMEFPYVIKPIAEGSSLGVHIVNEENDIPRSSGDWKFGAEALVEEYIPGREIGVAIMGDKALGAIEICPTEDFYNYEAKYTAGKTRHVMPAAIPEEDYKKALEIGLKAHKALGCKGISRIDLRYDDTKGTPGKFYVLEANTQPGMVPLSLVPEIAAHVGISFNDLVKWMIENASCHELNH